MCTRRDSPAKGIRRWWQRLARPLGVRRGANAMDPTFAPMPIEAVITRVHPGAPLHGAPPSARTQRCTSSARPGPPHEGRGRPQRQVGARNAPTHDEPRKHDMLGSSTRERVSPQKAGLRVAGIRMRNMMESAAIRKQSRSQTSADLAGDLLRLGDAEGIGRVDRQKYACFTDAFLHMCARSVRIAIGLSALRNLKNPPHCPC